MLKAAHGGRDWACAKDLNLGSPAYDAGALPLSYVRHKVEPRSRSMARV